MVCVESDVKVGQTYGHLNRTNIGRTWLTSLFRYCRYTTNQHGIMSDDQNMLLLRSDLHHLFDTRRIALIPKQIDLDTSRPPQLLVHVLEPSISAQLVPLYHNRCLQHI